MLADSTFVNDLVREDPEAVAVLEDLLATETPLAIATLTIFEVGVGLSEDMIPARDRFQTFIRRADAVPFGREQAQQALAIQRRLYDRGEPIGAVDAMIAGVAATREDPRVLTRNTDEFDRVSVIEVEPY